MTERCSRRRRGGETVACQFAPGIERECADTWKVDATTAQRVAHSYTTLASNVARQRTIYTYSRAEQPLLEFLYENSNYGTWQYFCPQWANEPNGLIARQAFALSHDFIEKYCSIGCIGFTHFNVFATVYLVISRYYYCRLAVPYLV